ncbi:STAS domain-containing protein [Dongia sedimenti]|uniref:STAS domain-containing protein n=1 Tax=Dongia sedimenti TaxID=3064282 RepID=A0ABU0YMM7_9PROT|nr:STAS domain-containing protein [Rhodospirillaceae bacterium R-7]
MAQADIGQTIAKRRAEILKDWGHQLRDGGALSSGRLKEAELDTQVREFLDLFVQAVSTNEADTARKALRQNVAEVSRARAIQGFTPTETATFIFSLKQPLFDALTQEFGKDSAALIQGLLAVTEILDGLGLHSMETFQKSREEVIIRQQKEIAELSTPVVKLWDGILALPLIGTLDSERTQVVMENLLQSIVEHGADYAIIDITGVPTVDTLVAQHLLKTVAAARLMGADCIISGIRPQIAQTMVHLGVELNVVSKANLADALGAALRATGRTVATIKSASGGSALSKA